MLMRTDPFRELDRLAQQALGTPTRPAAMPIDAYRRGDEFIVELDLPGVDAESIDLTVERNVLTVHAQRRRATDGDIELLVGERPQGTFSRQMFLGDTLDTAHIAADYTDGVLTLKLPVAERAKPRRVPISHPRRDRADKAIDAIDATADPGADSRADLSADDRVLVTASAGTG